MDFFRFAQKKIDGLVEKHAKHVKSGAVVLDVGCGLAPYRKLFSNCSYKTHDFLNEYSPDICCDILSIPEDQPADVVICTEVLEHVPEPIPAVQKLARLLKPGGMLILSAPLRSRIHQDPYHFYGGFTEFWYKHFCEKAGLKIASIERIGLSFQILGQEVEYCSFLLDPRKAESNRERVLKIVPWLVSLPLRLVFPIAGFFLDKMFPDWKGAGGYFLICHKA